MAFDLEEVRLLHTWLETQPDGRHSRSLEVYDALPKFSLVRDRESTDENLREWNNVTIGLHTVRMTMAAASLPSSAPGDRDRPVPVCPRPRI